MHVNFPRQTRTEAMSARLQPPGRGKGSNQASTASILPEPDGGRLGRALKDDTISTMETKFRDRLDERIDAVQASPNVPDAVKRSLRTLASKLRDANKFTEHPPTTYADYSKKYNAFTRDFKDLLKHIAEGLKEKES
jgi:hypothetical protein